MAAGPAVQRPLEHSGWEPATVPAMVQQSSVCVRVNMCVCGTAVLGMLVIWLLSYQNGASKQADANCTAQAQHHDGA